MWQHKSLKEIGDEAQQRLWDREKKAELEQEANNDIESLKACGVTVPAGYAETMDCLNKPSDWDVPGMIADMAEYIRQGLDVPPGQLLAALDWMTFRLKESASAMRDANITEFTAEAIKKLKGY